ncbi:MAG: hypothetical protein AB1425_12345, partial [Actinomycetota bacterium]
KLVYSESFTADRRLLATFAALAAFYLLSETLNQALFALGRARLAALGWLCGLLCAAVCLLALPLGSVERVAVSLALGTLAAALAQAIFYLGARSRAAGL